MMLLAFALILSGPGQADAAPLAIEHGAAFRASATARATAKASIRILHAARAGRDYGHERPPGSHPMTVRVTSPDGASTDVQVIEFE